MRTIKFRAWDKENKKMLPVTQLNIGGSVFVSDSPEHPDRRIESLDCKVMQFTGLLDKNGVEIFEGDIVKGSWPANNVHVIKFDDIATGCAPFNDDYFFRGKNVEVIGNIYENGDLLKCN